MRTLTPSNYYTTGKVNFVNVRHQRTTRSTQLLSLRPLCTSVLWAMLHTGGSQLWALLYPCDKTSH